MAAATRIFAAVIFAAQLMMCSATAAPAATSAADDLVTQALAAEARFDSRGALELFLQAEKAGRGDAFVLQKIARQYSDLTLDLPKGEAQRSVAERALAYSRRAAELEPKNAVNVLSIAISYGKLALASGTRDQVRFSRLVREEAERALGLDPQYAWAHHVLGRWHYEVATLGATARTFVRLFYGGLPNASMSDAIRHLERARQLEPEELQHHLELGFAYLANGDSSRARAAFVQGLAMPSRAKHDDVGKARARAALEKLPK